MTDTTQAAVDEQLALVEGQSKIMTARAIVQKMKGAVPDNGTKKTDFYQLYVQARTFCAYYEQLPD